MSVYLNRFIRRLPGIYSYTSPYEWRNYISPDKRAPIRFKKALKSFIIDKIKEANLRLDESKINWDTSTFKVNPGLFTDDNTTIKSAIQLIELGGESTTFNYVNISGKSFFENKLELPNNIILEYANEISTYLTKLGFNTEITDLKEDPVTGFREGYLYVRNNQDKTIDVNNDMTTIRLLSETMYEDNISAIHRIKIIDEPSAEWFKSITNLIDLRAHAHPLLSQYMEILTQKINYYGFITGYNTNNNTYTMKNPYGFINYRALNTGKYKNNLMLSSFRHETEYASVFNQTFFSILFGLASSPNIRDIVGDDEPVYKPSKITSKYTSEIPAHSTINQLFLSSDNAYLYSSLDGKISTSDDDYNPKYPNSVGNYRGQIIELNSGTLYSTTRFYLDAKIKNYNTVGLRIPYLDMDYKFNLYNRCKELLNLTPIGKLSKDIGYRRTETSIGG